MSEYYGASSGIPASGTLSMGNFYGASGAFSYTLSSDMQEGIIHSIVTANGWDGSSGVEFIIGSGVYCWSDNVSVAGLSTGGPFPGGLTIVNNGYLMGRGGDANSNNPNSPVAGVVINGGAGGPALDLSVPVTIDNTNGYIGGGGGGGAHALAGGGAGGGKCPGTHTFTSGVVDETLQDTYVTPANNVTVPLGGTGTHLLAPNNYEAYVVQTGAVDALLTPSGGGGNSGQGIRLNTFL